VKIVVEIDLNRIEKNILATKRLVGVPVMLMVKADAYGHGLIKVAKRVENLVSAFGVETLEEGLKLRRAGIKSEILVLALCENEIYRAYRQDLTIGLHNGNQFVKIVSLINSNRINPAKLKTHVKVDSGMHRLGFRLDELRIVLQNAKSLGINVSGIYSHLRDETESQKGAFDAFVEVAKGYYPDIKAHLASSHSLFNSNLRYDGVRLGINAYEGAMSAYSQVIESRRLQAGERVSYGDFALQKATNTAVVFGGYADGVCRENPSDVYIDGRACKVIGNVCMDTFVVDTGGYVAKVGDEVVLVDENSILTVANQRKTIEYTVYTSFKGRVKRYYKHNGQETSENSGES